MPSLLNAIANKEVAHKPKLKNWNIETLKNFIREITQSNFEVQITFAINEGISGAVKNYIVTIEIQNPNRWNKVFSDGNFAQLVSEEYVERRERNFLWC